MQHSIYKRALAASLGAMFLGIVPLPASADDVAAQVAAVRLATERFADVNVALAEGFIPDPSGHCVSAEAEGLPAELGAMGIHYLNPALLGITATEPRVDGNGLHTDFLQPSILLYEPQADGSLELVGAENLVFEKAWKEAGNGGPPVIAGRDWDYMADDPATPGDEAHGFEPHYDQHVWFRENPRGALEPFNPAVTCEHHVASH
ncbi:MAG TPA: hypothetical protein VLQ65_03605 [Saliniramus sp.]|nr:hypothetical protein [Saliniramus sp.]